MRFTSFPSSDANEYLEYEADAFGDAEANVPDTPNDGEHPKPFFGRQRSRHKSTEIDG